MIQARLQFYQVTANDCRIGSLEICISSTYCSLPYRQLRTPYFLGGLKIPSQG